jgi:hypothetical protein
MDDYTGSTFSEPVTYISRARATKKPNQYAFVVAGGSIFIPGYMLSGTAVQSGTLLQGLKRNATSGHMPFRAVRLFDSKPDDQQYDGIGEEHASGKSDEGTCEKRAGSLMSDETDEAAGEYYEEDGGENGHDEQHGDYGLHTGTVDVDALRGDLAGLRVDIANAALALTHAHARMRRMEAALSVRYLGSGAQVEVPSSFDAGCAAGGDRVT